MQTTKESLKAFRTDFALAVAGLEKKYDVKINLGTINYSDIDFHTKLTVALLNAKTGEKKVDTSAFNLYKDVYGLKCERLFTFFSPKGLLMTVIDIDPKKKKNNVILKGSDGKTYIAPVAMVNLFVE